MDGAQTTDGGHVGHLSRAFAWTVVRLRFLVVPAWLAAAVAATVALPGLGGGSPAAGIEPGNTRAAAVEARSAQRFGAPLVARTMVVQRDVRGLPPGARRRALERTGAVHDRSLAALRGVASLVNAGPLARSPRERGTTAISYLFFAPDASLDTQDATAHAYARRYVDRPGDALAGVTGASPARVAQWQQISDALPVVTVVTVLLIALIAGLRFGAIGAPLVALAAAAIAYLVAVRVVGWLGERARVTVPQEVEPVIVVLLLGVVTDYAIFYLSGTRRGLAHGRRRADAAQESAAANAPIVFTAGILVAAGTAALLFGRSDFFRAFGPGLAVTALVGMAVSMTFLPAALAILGRATFWPRGPGERGPAGAPDRRRRFRLARLATARPVALVLTVACVAGLGAAASGLAGLHLAFPLMRDLPPGAEPARAATAAQRGFAPGIVAPAEVLVERPGIARATAQLARLRDLLAARPGVAGVVGPAAGPAAQLPPGVLVSRDGGAARYAVVLGVDPLGAKGIAATRRLRDDLPGLVRQAGLPGARAGVAGDSALGAETIDRMLGDLLRVALAALLATFVVLAIFLRSLTAALVLLATSVLALAASLGVTTLLFEHVLGFDGLAWYVPFTVAVLLVALGSDYNVFVTGRVWQQARGMPLRDAIATAAPRAAKAIVVAGITLALSFAALALVPLRSFRELAFALSFGVLLETFLVRSVLVPALLALVRPREAGRDRVLSPRPDAVRGRAEAPTGP